MKSKTFKIITFTLLGIFCLSMFSIHPTLAADYNVCSAPGVSDEVRQAAGCSGNANALPDIIENILNAIIAITGTIAVIYVVVGGVNYMTSNGDTSKLEKAKKTILYAVIGLAVSVLAFAIVNWTINAIRNSSPSNFTDQSSCEGAGHTWENNACK